MSNLAMERTVISMQKYKSMDKSGVMMLGLKPTAAKKTEATSISLNALLNGPVHPGGRMIMH